MKEVRKEIKSTVFDSLFTSAPWAKPRVTLLRIGGEEEKKEA